MRKKFNVIITTMIAASMLMTACGAKGNKPGNTAADVAEVEVVDGKEMIGNMYVEGYPIVKEPMTFTMMSRYETRQTKFGEMDFFKKINEKTNIDIDWELVASTDWVQKKNLKLASGVYPDAFYAGIDDKDVALYGPQGIFIDLEDYINKYAPNIKKAFEKYPEFEASCRAVDGKIYSLSSLYVDPGAYNPDQLFINKTWLDNLGLEVPTTVDEFYDVLKAFKTQDPNGNGIADEIPYSARFDSHIQGYHSLFGAFGRVDINGKNEYSHFVVEDGEVVFTADKEEYKTAIAELHRFFAEGLFDEEIFTQDMKQYFAKGKTQEMTLGAFTLWNRANMVGPERVEDYVPVGPLKGTDKDPVWTREVGASGGETTFAITNQCENPEVVIRWIDTFFDEVTSVETAWGPITEGENGIYTFDATDSDQSFDDYRYQQAPIWGPALVAADFYDRVVEMPYTMVEKVEIMKEYYEKYMTNETLPFLKFTEEETEWFTSRGADINNHVEDYQSKWLLNGGIEEEWDDYILGLEQLGIDTHVENMRNAYARFTQK